MAFKTKSCFWEELKFEKALNSGVFGLPCRSHLVACAKWKIIWKNSRLWCLLSTNIWYTNCYGRNHLNTKKHLYGFQNQKLFLRGIKIRKSTKFRCFWSSMPFTLGSLCEMKNHLKKQQTLMSPVNQHLTHNDCIFLQIKCIISYLLYQ